jgi:hypothetical protein
MRLVKEKLNDRVQVVTKPTAPPPLLGRVAELSKERAVAALNNDQTKARELNIEAKEILAEFDPTL